MKYFVEIFTCYQDYEKYLYTTSNYENWTSNSIITCSIIKE
jgi:hypothetical protein